MTLAGVVILSGVITLLGAEGGLKNYIKLLCSLSVLCVLVSPLVSLATDGDFSLNDLWDSVQNEEVNYDEIYKESWKKYEIETAQKILKESMISKLSMEASDFEVAMKIVSKSETIELESVTVVLRDRGVLADPKKISSFINTELGCPCIIVYD